MSCSLERGVFIGGIVTANGGGAVSLGQSPEIERTDPEKIFLLPAERISFCSKLFLFF
jgi:hypothetical protein